MRSYLLVLLLLLLVHTAWSQEDYPLFRPGVQYVYTHQLLDSPATSPLLGMLIDDSPCQSTYESLQPNIPAGDWLCYTRVPAFIGSEICRDGGLTQLNLGSVESPLWLELQTAAPIGSQWLAALAPDSVFARVDDIYWGEVLGLTDSIKAIGFYDRNDQGQLVPLYEEAPLLVSQSYGLVKAIFLHWLGEEVGPIDLVGLSQPAVGIQNPHRATIFNLSGGDELHWKESFTGTSPEGLFLVTHREKRATLVEEFWTGGNDSLHYVFSTDYRTYFAGTDPPTDTIYTPVYLDTFTYYWPGLSYLDQQPGALLPHPTEDDVWRTVMLGYQSRCELPAKQWSTPVFISDAECGEIFIDAPLDVEYYENISGPYYEFADVSGFDFDFRTPKYVNLANGLVCGEPCDFVTSTRSPVAKATVATWPNPVEQVLRWDAPSSAQPFLANILNAQGQVLISNSTRSGQSVDVSSLPPGAYWLQLIAPSGQHYSTSPFIKQ